MFSGDCNYVGHEFSARLLLVLAVLRIVCFAKSTLPSVPTKYRRTSLTLGFANGEIRCSASHSGNHGNQNRTYRAAHVQHRTQRQQLQSVTDTVTLRDTFAHLESSSAALAALHLASSSSADCSRLVFSAAARAAAALRRAVSACATATCATGQRRRGTTAECIYVQKSM